MQDLHDSGWIYYPWHELPWNQVVNTVDDPDLVLKLRLPRKHFDESSRERHNHKILVWIRENETVRVRDDCCRMRIVAIMHDQSEDPQRYFFDEIEIPVIKTVLSREKLLDSISTLAESGRVPFEIGFDFRYWKWRFRIELDLVVSRAMELSI